jgi:hypothetical protein
MWGLLHADTVRVRPYFGLVPWSSGSMLNPYYITRRLILPQPQEHHLPHEAISRPCEVTNLRDDFRPYPRHFGNLQRRPEAGVPRRRLTQGHCLDRQRLQQSVQSLQRLVVHSGAGPACVDEAPVFREVAQQ